MIIIYGKNKTIEKFEEFLLNGLRICDPEDVEYTDLHRIPQHPVKKAALEV